MRAPAGRVMGSQACPGGFSWALPSVSLIVDRAGEKQIRCLFMGSGPLKTCRVAPGRIREVGDNPRDGRLSKLRKPACLSLFLPCTQNPVSSAALPSLSHPGRGFILASARRLRMASRHVSETNPPSFLL